MMVEAPQILGDGTFRIIPAQWYQTFIVSVQISPGVVIPDSFYCYFHFAKAIISKMAEALTS